MLAGLTERQEWKFFAALPKADRPLTIAFWVVLVLRGVLPALFAVATGVIIGELQHHQSTVIGVTAAAVTFIALQVLAPFHQAICQNLGSRMAAWLFDRLTAACVNPPGIAHLEEPTLSNDLTVAREFDAFRP